jgi:hypothetical protein
MKTTYQFNLVGTLKSDITFPIKIGEVTLSFLSDGSKIYAVEVSETSDVGNLPFMKNGIDGVTELTIDGFDIQKLMNPIKMAEGMLSLFGLEEINTREVRIKWVPENKEEEELIVISEFTYKEEARGLEEEIAFDLIARPFIAGFLSSTYEVAFSFYRRGKNDIKSFQYIEAFYDFYFLLESLFGNGKTKNTAIENEFLASKELLDSIREVSHDKSMEKLFKKEHISEYIESYVNKTPQEIISTIVKKRGFLHHHNPKHPETWNPDGQERFRVDAIFLMHLTSRSRTRHKWRWTVPTGACFALYAPLVSAP